MARLFNGTTDRIDYTKKWNPQGAQISISMWVYRTQVGEYGYLYHLGRNNTTFGLLVGHPGNTNDGAVRFYREGSVQDEVRTSVNNVLTLNTWVHLLITDSDFTDASTIFGYLNGAGFVWSTAQSGNTEVSYDATNWSLGGRDYDDARNFGGYICRFGMWNRVLSSREIWLLAQGAPPSLFKLGLKIDVPLMRDGKIEYVNQLAGALDGTSVVAEPDKVIAFNTWLAKYVGNRPIPASWITTMYPNSPLLTYGISPAAPTRMPRYGFTNFQVPGIV